MTSDASSERRPRWPLALAGLIVVRLVVWWIIGALIAQSPDRSAAERVGAVGTTLELAFIGAAVAIVAWQLRSRPRSPHMVVALAALALAAAARFSQAALGLYGVGEPWTITAVVAAKASMLPAQAVAWIALALHRSASVRGRVRPLALLCLFVVGFDVGWFLAKAPVLGMSLGLGGWVHALREVGAAALLLVPLVWPEVVPGTERRAPRASRAITVVATGAVVLVLVFATSAAEYAGLAVAGAACLATFAWAILLATWGTSRRVAPTIAFVGSASVVAIGLYCWMGATHPLLGFVVELDLAHTGGSWPRLAAEAVSVMAVVAATTLLWSSVRIIAAVAAACVVALAVPYGDAWGSWGVLGVVFLLSIGSVAVCRSQGDGSEYGC